MRLTRLILALVVVFAAIACEPPTSTPRDAGADVGVDSTETVDITDAPRARIATFNVRLMFDRNCDSGRCDPGDFEDVPSEQEYDLHLQRTAEAIEAFEPDVVLLQEVENADVLQDLRSRLDPEYTIGVLGETGFSASLDVGVIARGELLRTETYRDTRPLDLPGGGESQFTREFLQLNLQIRGEELIVFSAHFKAKSNDDPGRRLAEAQEAREIIGDVAAQNDGALVVLGGDLNDYPGSDPLDALTSNGGLERAGDEKPNDQMWTFEYRGDLQAIDHLLLAPTAGGAYVESSATVVRDASGSGLADSDHAALFADFEMY